MYTLLLNYHSYSVASCMVIKNFINYKLHHNVRQNQQRYTEYIYISSNATCLQPNKSKRSTKKMHIARATKSS